MGATAVAMSGGVDSSVAACLLAGERRSLVGFSMQLVDRLAGETERYGRCCSPDDFRDARSVADRLGFPHYVLDMEDEFVKFGALLTRARAVGAGKVATGHYAILEPDPETGRTLLRQAHDRDKDQSYFLFDMSEEQRRHAEFPLGRLTKDEVRKLARTHGLSNADKPESMDLCFVSRDESYRDFLERQGLTTQDAAGEIVNREGRVLGRHDGVAHYTVGQRRGIGVTSERPLYVLNVEPQTRRVVVGHDEELLHDRCVIERTRWIPFEHPVEDLRARVRIRSTHDGAPATVRRVDDERVEILFDEPQRAITPGQAAVAYSDDLVLGGGWIAA